MEPFKKVEGKRGWFRESKRHSLAAKGQTTLPFFAKKRKPSRKGYLKEYKELKRLENTLEKSKREEQSTPKMNYEQFRMWVQPKLRRWDTPHALRYARAIINSNSFNETRKKLVRLDKEHDLPVLSDFETLVDMFKREQIAPSPKRDNLTLVLDVIKDIEKEYGYAKREEIIKNVLEDHSYLKESDIEKALEKLRLDGHIYEPRFNKYKIA